jgi:hypothetical protein
VSPYPAADRGTFLPWPAAWAKLRAVFMPVRFLILSLILPENQISCEDTGRYQKIQNYPYGLTKKSGDLA